MLTSAAAALGVAAVPTTATAATGWTEVSTPTTRTLFDVTYTDNDAYAVGGDGVVLHRQSGEWSTVTDDGPGGNGSNLSGSGVSDDGEALWVVGASGAIGEYDVSTGTFTDHTGSVTDHTAPDDYTGNFRDVAVTGDAGAANVFVTDDSGIVHYSFDDGETWAAVTPGSGSTIPAVDFYDTLAGHVSDTNQKVMATTDGENYDAIGIGNVDENFYGLDSDGAEDVWVCGNRGKVFHYDGSWSTATLGDVVLRDIGVAADDSDGYTVGSDGRVFTYAGAWSEESTPTDADLKAVVRDTPDSYDSGTGGLLPPFDEDLADIAVGADGTVIEKRP